MDKSFTCECGNSEFWFFWSFVRCTKCYNEYEEVLDVIFPERWIRRFNKETNKYEDNWEKISNL